MRKKNNCQRTRWEVILLGKIHENASMYLFVLLYDATLYATKMRWEHLDYISTVERRGFDQLNEVPTYPSVDHSSREDHDGRNISHVKKI